MLIEGAGSPAEVNLRERDIANMGFARAGGNAGRPDRRHRSRRRHRPARRHEGGASRPRTRDMIVGFLVNKFRGDASLFDDGMRFIAERTGWRALGLIPFFAAAHRLPAEDAVVLDARARRSARRVTIAVPMLARIANFDDFDPLRLEPNVRLVMVRPGEPLPLADLVILPGTQGDDRRPRVLSRAGVGHRSLRPCPARRPGAREFAAAIRCSGAPRRPAGARRAGGRSSRARAHRRRDDAGGREGASRRCRDLPRQRRTVLGL